MRYLRDMKVSPTDMAQRWDGWVRLVVGHGDPERPLYCERFRGSVSSLAILTAQSIRPCVRHAQGGVRELRDTVTNTGPGNKRSAQGAGMHHPACRPLGLPGLSCGWERSLWRPHAWEAVSVCQDKNKTKGTSEAILSASDVLLCCLTVVVLSPCTSSAPVLSSSINSEIGASCEGRGGEVGRWCTKPGESSARGLWSDGLACCWSLLLFLGSGRLV